MNDEVDVLNFDVVIIGAGPAGLSAAIRLKQEAKKNNIDISVCIIEKGSEVGAHIISGAVIETSALESLFSDWKDNASTIMTEVCEDKFLYLTKNNSIAMPIPPQLNNQNNYIVSLGVFCRWLGEQASSLGVEIFPGFSAVDILYDADGSVSGILTGEMGLNKYGKKTKHYQPGIKLVAKQTVFSEGCRGSLTKKLINKFNLAKDSDSQVYALGFKEIWEVPNNLSNKGKILHIVGWPIPKDVFGGAFLYHLNDNLISIGLVVGLDYKNPWFSPYETFQQFKKHPLINKILSKGKRISYGARSLTEGGYQSLPRLSVPGGLLIGDAAGFLNVPKIKGTHMAMESGILAADSILKGLKNSDSNKINETDYNDRTKNSRLMVELYQARNIRPAFHWGLWPGLFFSAMEMFIFKGNSPWTLHHKNCSGPLMHKDECKKINYPKHDEKLSFDRSTSIFYANIKHNSDQPVHLSLRDESLAISVNYNLYGSPEVRYCPAEVYMIVDDDSVQKKLQINAQNCLHCKACDIKDPTQNINWLPPEGASGPNYSMM